MGTDYLNEKIETREIENGFFELTRVRDQGFITTFSTRKEAEHFANLHNAELDRKAQPVTSMIDSKGALELITMCKIAAVIEAIATNASKNHWGAVKIHDEAALQARRISYELADDRKLLPVTRLLIARNDAGDYIVINLIEVSGTKEQVLDIGFSDPSYMEKSYYSFVFPRHVYEYMPMFANALLDLDDDPHTYELRGVFVPVETEEEAKT